MKYPNDLKEIVVLELTNNLKDYTELNKFQVCNTQDLYMYHFGLGTFLRNYYKLWETIEEYVSEDEFIHPDDVSFEFLKEAQKQLQEN